MADSSVQVDIQADQLSLFVYDAIHHGFTELLKATERQVRDTNVAKADWQVLTEPRFHVTVSPNGVPEADLDAIATSAWSMLTAARQQLSESGEVDVPGVAPQLQRVLRNIVHFLGSEVEEIDVQINDLDIIELTNPHRAEQRKLTRHEEYGSLTGVIDLVSVRGPVPYFTFRDNNTGRLVRGYFDQELRSTVLGGLEKLADISGLVRYREDWQPMSIRPVEEIFVYPDPPADIHQEIDRLMGSIPDLLGDLSIEDHMDQVRGRGELG